MARALWKGAVIAESQDTIEVEGNLYFPPEDVAEEHLEPSPTTSTCGWKGKARYYHLVVDGERNEDAAWYYPDPKPEADHVAGRIAFWNGVEMQRRAPARRGSGRPGAHAEA